MASNRSWRIAAALCVVLACGALIAIWLGDPTSTKLVSEPPRGPDAQAAPAVGETARSQAPPAATTPAPKPESAEIAPLDARLVATVIRTDPSRSFAAIARLDGSQTELLSVGDHLTSNPQARITAIGDGFVDVDHAGTSVRLTATSSLDPLAERFLEAVRNAPRREISEAERERRQALVDRVRARIEAGPGSGRSVSGTGLFAEARTVAHWDEDRLVAIELEDIEPGGFYDAVGLQNGDRIETINGIPLGDPDAAPRILIELATADEIVADVERPDGPGEVSIPTEQLRNFLEGLSAEEVEALQAIGDLDSLPVDIPSDAIPAPPTD
jgi:type II secretory pathway component PulC